MERFGMAAVAQQIGQMPIPETEYVPKTSVYALLQLTQPFRAVRGLSEGSNVS